jgi:predicted transcriptional regulator
MRRSDLDIVMDIFKNLLKGPRMRTNLAQDCHLGYRSLMKFVDELERLKHVQVLSEGEREMYSLTDSGRSSYVEYEKLRDKVFRRKD